MTITVARCDVCWQPPSWAWPVSEERIAAFPGDLEICDPFLFCDACHQIVLSGVDVVKRLVQRLQAGQPITVQFGGWTVINREGDEDDLASVVDLLDGLRGNYWAFG